MSLLTSIAPGFHSIRGSFKLGVLDLGTQCSLVRRHGGKFVLLDSLEMLPSVLAEVNQLTSNGREIEAIINVHPFHTLHCAWAHQTFPHAKLYGSARHVTKLPGLPWEPERVDTPALHAKFESDLAFSVPKGVDFISTNEAVHFSSVVVLHKDSSTVHVDDTFLFVPLPKAAEFIGIKEGAVGLHPTLPAALERRAGAAEDFREWLTGIADGWPMLNLCAAHSGNLLARDHTGKSISARLKEALWLAEPILLAHEAIYGCRPKL